MFEMVILATREYRVEIKVGGWCELGERLEAKIIFLFLIF